jgi:hypothetical protein
MDIIGNLITPNKKWCIDWSPLSLNPNATKPVLNPVDWYLLYYGFSLNYDEMKENKRELNKSIIEKYWHPDRIIKFLNQKDLEDLEDL